VPGAGAASLVPALAGVVLPPQPAATAARIAMAATPANCFLMVLISPLNLDVGVTISIS
jgi:hypothetical protein